MKDLMHIVGVAFELVIAVSGGILRQHPAGLSEKAHGKVHIDTLFNLIQKNLLCTVIKRLRVRSKHPFQDMPVAPGKDKLAVAAFLYMRPKERLRIFLLVFCNLLEFVDGKNAVFIRLVEIKKNLLQG